MSQVLSGSASRCTRPDQTRHPPPHPRLLRTHQRRRCRRRGWLCVCGRTRLSAAYARFPPSLAPKKRRQRAEARRGWVAGGWVYAWACRVGFKGAVTLSASFNPRDEVDDSLPATSRCQERPFLLRRKEEAAVRLNKTFTVASGRAARLHRRLSTHCRPPCGEESR